MRRSADSACQWAIRPHQLFESGIGMITHPLVLARRTIRHITFHTSRVCCVRASCRKGGEVTCTHNSSSTLAHAVVFPWEADAMPASLSAHAEPAQKRAVLMGCSFASLQPTIHGNAVVSQERHRLEAGTAAHRMDGLDWVDLPCDEPEDEPVCEEVQTPHANGQFDLISCLKAGSA